MSGIRKAPVLPVDRCRVGVAFGGDVGLNLRGKSEVVELMLGDKFDHLFGNDGLVDEFRYVRKRLHREASFLKRVGLEGSALKRRPRRAAKRTARATLWARFRGEPVGALMES